MKVSIIIPLYNRKTLIERCLQSCINQTMAKSDYEIIVVDDCSTDGSYDVICEYRAKYPPGFINVARLPKNSGSASAPRNHGLELANAEYVFFVDSDDYIDEETLLDGYKLASANDSDLVLVKRAHVKDGTPIYLSSTFRDKKFIDLHTRHNYGNIPVCSVNNLRNLRTVHVFFKAQLLKYYNIKFDLSVTKGEDFYFINDLICAIARKRIVKISCISKKIYYFLSRDDDIKWTSGGEHLTSRKITTDEALYQLMRWCDLCFEQGFIEGHAAKYAMRKFHKSFFSKLHNIVKNFQNYNNLSDKDLNIMSDFLDENLPLYADKLLKPEEAIIITAIRNKDKEELVRYGNYVNINKKMGEKYEKIKTQLSQIKTSTSWRVTKPLRAIKKYLTNRNM